MRRNTGRNAHHNLVHPPFSIKTFLLLLLSLFLLQRPRIVSSFVVVSSSATVSSIHRTVCIALPDHHPHHHHRQQKQEHHFLTKKNQEPKVSDDQRVVYYNDDAFGLVFLVGFFVAKDIIFSSLFLGLSAIAAIATTNNKQQNQLLLSLSSKQLPGAVAAVTFLLTVGVSFVVDHQTVLPFLTTFLQQSPAPNPNCQSIELAFCSFSFLYAFLSKPTTTNE